MKNLVLGALLSSAATVTYAGCWMECVTRNPFSGGCVAKAKVCNVEDAGRAVASLGKDIGSAFDNLRGFWQDIYGAVPDPLRFALDRYPLTFASVIMPETRAYTIVLMALEDFVGRAKHRSHRTEEFLQAAPTWKKEYSDKGQAIVLTLDITQVSNVDYNKPESQPIPDKFSGIWDGFLVCLNAAQDRKGGEDCLYNLQVAAASVRY